MGFFSPKAILVKNFCPKVGMDCDGYIYDHNGNQISECGAEHFDSWVCSECDFGHSADDCKNKVDVGYHIVKVHEN